MSNTTVNRWSCVSGRKIVAILFPNNNFISYWLFALNLIKKLIIIHYLKKDDIICIFGI